MRNSGKIGKPCFPDKRPIYYYITDRKRLARLSVLECIRRNIERGVDFVQIREKDLSDRALFELACRAVALARRRGCRILINGRADIALACGAAGVHLPSTGLRVEDLLNSLPPRLIVGVSVHSRREALRAAEAGADYVLLGPVFYTESKAEFGLPLGLNKLRQICSAVRFPVLGLGGMSEEKTSLVLDAGAAGIAGVTMFQQ